MGSFVGILEKEQEQSVVYGSTDFGKTCTTNEKYRELVNRSKNFIQSFYSLFFPARKSVHIT